MVSIGILICIISIITEEIPLGITFVLSLGILLYLLFTMLNKRTALTRQGIVYLVIALMIVVYSICVLFLKIDVKAVLGLREFLETLE